MSNKDNEKFPNVTHYTQVDVQPGGINIQHVEHLHQADVLEALGIELEVKQKGGKEEQTRADEEEMCHFIHPSLDDEEGWKVHEEIKRLVSRQGVQEICSHLLELSRADKILLPQMPSVAYKEFVRMGMPNGEGFNEKTFQKHYKR